MPRTDLRFQNSSIQQPYYTASLSPFLQGTEIVQLFQLFDYSWKFRANTSFSIATNGLIPGYRSQSQSTVPFDDTVFQNNFGNLALSSSLICSPGRTSYDGERKNILSSSVSKVNIDSPQRLNIYVSHIMEQRVLGQISSYNNGEPFVDPDIIEKNPKVVIEKHASQLVIPTSMVLASDVFSFDGVIEPLSIRKIVDRSLIELPYVFNSIKSNLEIVDDKKRSYVIQDFTDLDELHQQRSLSPFFDSQGVSKGGVQFLNPENIFSDKISNLPPFNDGDDSSRAYSGSLDSSIRKILISGISISGSLHSVSSLDFTQKNQVISRHGFLFSQNDNFNYDSIAFGGLKR